MKKNILITICARGGSKGIPKKNIKNLGGIPLIAYSLNLAKKFKSSVSEHVDIALSTDSKEIIKVVSELGLATDYIRPDYLADDKAGKLDVFKDVREHYQGINKISYDYLLDLDVSSPLRNLEDLMNGYKIIEADKEAINLFSVNNAHKNPYFNMVEQGTDGYYHVSKSLASNILSRQTAPKVYELNASFYFFKKIFFDKDFNSVYSGKALIYEMPHVCFDLDNKIDFDFMEFLIDNKRLDFEL